MACGCSTPAYLRDPRNGAVIPTATAVAIGQAVETSEGPAAAPDFVATPEQMQAANANNKAKPKIEQLKNLAIGIGAGFLLKSVLR